MTDEKNTVSKYVVAHLEKKHNRNEFKCGVDALDDYLKTQASQEMKKNVAVTYVLTSGDSEQVLGYYTLSSIGIVAGELPEDIIKKLPRYPVLPGILIGRLARDKKFHGRDIGLYLLMDALKRSLDISNQLGSVAVIVDAKNEKAVAFYKDNDFIEFPENNRRLFLSMGTIKKLNL
jgi:ribosomal protein S18 acetylase RimI-like enzyme